jgi:hypothetical protein
MAAESAAAWALRRVGAWAPIRANVMIVELIARVMAFSRVFEFGY